MKNLSEIGNRNRGHSGVENILHEILNDESLVIKVRYVANINNR